MFKFSRPNWPKRGKFLKNETFLIILRPHCVYLLAIMNKSQFFIDHHVFVLFLVAKNEVFDVQNILSDEID